MASSPSPRITLRPAGQRGRTRIDWLDSWHTFSFGGYFSPDHMGFGPLRVINDDTVGPGGGFDEHGHRDMEILTWVLSGGLAHRDSVGGGAVIRPGELQTMSAGRGIRHSEFNASSSEPVHFLQVWILPREKGLTPSYRQQRFDPSAYRGRWGTVASPDGRDGALRIEQDATVRVADLDAQPLSWSQTPDRQAWLHVATGAAALNGQSLAAGDGVAIQGAGALTLQGTPTAHVLLFDLPLSHP